MKRRVLIAKALSHEPTILFLDEPTAGVDVELRQDMWKVVESLRKTGVTIILTTHYIEEAEAIADRVGVINKGELLPFLSKKTQATLKSYSWPGNVREHENFILKLCALYTDESIMNEDLTEEIKNLKKERITIIIAHRINSVSYTHLTLPTKA